jgi:hypothetical protein
MASLLQLAGGSPPPCSLQAVGPTDIAAIQQSSSAATSDLSHCLVDATSCG